MQMAMCIFPQLPLLSFGMIDSGARVADESFKESRHGWTTIWS
jgi:hypothetical protein